MRLNFIVIYTSMRVHFHGERAIFIYGGKKNMGKGAKVLKTQLNRIKDGRGQGYGKDYVPFIQASDNKAPSEGYLIRDLGWKSERMHHLLSKEEFRYLMVLSWSDGVDDIREQYPLLPMERSLEIAEQLNIKHAHLNNEPVIATTDFMITTQTENGIVDVVRTFKPTKKLTPRTIELFQIEKIFFEEQGIDWGIIVDTSLPTNLVLNVQWMYEGKFLDTRQGLDTEVVKSISNSLLNAIVIDRGQTPIQKICLIADKKMGVENGSCMFILKHQLANKRWHTDMFNQQIRMSKPLIVWEDGNDL